ncbi:hypothetical protein OIE66_37725 [Nonomuraea sp. NBC_01738]|uniref:hypothetical protein n=1 Tax=Nonomuraea sp. NBC_01738 TaxID=2976003 RepID=UPI002E0F2F23|nr:hypothetical protein OIE66_37725 [Nonomuraea sp. NBC_01738]
MKLRSIAAALVLGAGVLAGTAAPAAAATCSGSHLDNWPIKGGYISVYYNSSTGYNCAMTYTSRPGVLTYIRVSIGVEGGSLKTDARNYKYYAGPVSVYGKGKCIQFYGQVGSGNPLEGVGNAYCG